VQPLVHGSGKAGHLAAGPAFRRRQAVCQRARPPAELVGLHRVDNRLWVIYRGAVYGYRADQHRLHGSPLPERADCFLEFHLYLHEAPALPALAGHPEEAGALLADVEPARRDVLRDVLCVRVEHVPRPGGAEFLLVLLPGVHCGGEKLVPSQVQPVLTSGFRLVSI